MLEPSQAKQMLWMVTCWKTMAGTVSEPCLCVCFFLSVLCWKNKEIKMTEEKEEHAHLSTSGYYENTARSSILKCVNGLKE